MMTSKTAAKGCWTCKDRKVSCDKNVPICLKCAKSKRVCGGYGMRLSWPKSSSSKRTLGSGKPHTETHLESQNKNEFHWINVSIKDVQLHAVATAADNHSWGKVTREQLTVSNIYEPVYQVLEGPFIDDLWLLQYFRDVVSKNLPVLGVEREVLCGVLLRMALAPNWAPSTAPNATRSANAVLLSLLTLSIFHRGTDLDDAQRMKDTAIRALIAAVDPDMGTQSAVEHIAAGLVLCIVETLQSVNNTSEWFGFLCGAKQLLQAVRDRLKGNCPAHTPGSDAAVILGWLSYFDVFARFPFRHWRTEAVKTTAVALGFDPESPECAAQYLIANSFFSKPVEIDPAFSHPIIGLVGQTMETRLYSSDPDYHSTTYQQQLQKLSSQLENISSTSSTQHVCRDTCNEVELTRFAALIYLERVSTNFSGTSEKLVAWVQSGLEVIAQLHSIPPAFSLFIIGCETHSDYNRSTLLDFFARMEQKPHMFTLMKAKSLIQTAWNQHDLAVEGRLAYIQKLNMVLSSRNVIPSFY